MPTAPEPRNARVHHALHCAWIGLVAGALAALLDIASTILWLSSADDQRRLVLVFALLGASASALAGALFGALFSQPVLALSSPRALARRALALAALPSIAIGHLLFTGGKMRRLPMRFALEPVAMLAVAALLSFSLVALILAVRELRAKTQPVRAVSAALFALCAMALHALDHRVLPRLYEYLHAVLGVATVAMLAAALALVSRAPSAMVTRVALASSPFALALALSLLSRWDNVRAEVFGTHAPFVRHIAIALEALTRRSRAVDARALASIERERAQRDALARSHERDPTLPRVAGAHVLLVTVDAMRADRLSPSHTPSLWAFAANGVRFSRAYTQAPHSSYAITSLHTGEHLHETVQLGQAQPLVTMARAFNTAGYRTVGLYTNGIFFTEGEKLTAYRDHHLDFSRSEHRDMDARATTDAAIRELDESLARAEPPTFLWAHYFDAHEPYRGAGATQRDRYDAALVTVDREIARLFTYARSHLHRPVIFALAADHGEEFGEHGGVYHGSALYEEQTRVPLVIVAPTVGARVIESPVALVDVAPTLLALAAVARPESARGRDLRPWMVGRAVREEPVFSAVNTRTMVVRWPHKLIADLRWGVRELYDLSLDPAERDNLAGRDHTRVSALEAELHGWLGALGGPSASAARVRMGDRAMVDAVVAVALDERAAIDARIAAIDALSTLRDRAVVTRALSLLRHPNSALRTRVAIGAALVGEASARAELLAHVGDDDPALRARVGLALAALGDRASTPALIEALRAGDEAERSAAIDAMARLGTRFEDGLPECESALIEALEDDHLRYRAALALGAVGRSHSFAIIHRIAVEDRADDARAWAAAGLSLTADRARASGALRERLLRDAPAQAFAASALLRVTAPGSTGWDARGAVSAPFVECGRSDDNEPWVTLDARACRLRGAAPLGRVVARNAQRLWVRARGEGALVVRASGREIARFSLESALREWRASVALTGDETLSVECAHECWLGHVVWLGDER